MESSAHPLSTIIIETNSTLGDFDKLDIQVIRELSAFFYRTEQSEIEFRSQ